MEKVEQGSGRVNISPASQTDPSLGGYLISQDKSEQDDIKYPGNR
jgi:hypothetical protein